MTCIKVICFYNCTDIGIWYLPQGKADDQVSWRVSQNEKLARLREKHRRATEQLVQGMVVTVTWVQFSLQVVVMSL